MKKIKLGFAPTRRSIFSAPDAVKYRGLTAQRLKELGVDFVDITDINEEGLLYDDKDVDKIVEKFKKEGVDGLMLPHCNFGTDQKSVSDAVPERYPESKGACAGCRRALRDWSCLCSRKRTGAVWR